MSFHSILEGIALGVQVIILLNFKFNFEGTEKTKREEERER